MHIRIRLLLLIRPFISFVFLSDHTFRSFLSNCEAFKIDIRYTSGQYEHISCSSFDIFSFFFSPVSNIRAFIALFLENMKATKLKLSNYTWTMIGILCTPESCCCCLFDHFYFFLFRLSFFFLSNFQIYQIFVTLF